MMEGLFNGRNRIEPIDEVSAGIGKKKSQSYKKNFKFPRALSLGFHVYRIYLLV